jgi:hypothetical protein
MSSESVLKITSNEMPAGQTKPIKLPGGPNKITVYNPNNGDGKIKFKVSFTEYSIEYHPGIPSTVLDIIVPAFPNPDDYYFCFMNEPTPGTVGKTVRVECDDLRP